MLKVACFDPVKFFTPISYGDQKTSVANAAMEAADGYFWLGGIQARVMPGRKRYGAEVVQLVPKESSYLVDGLKVASYFTIVVPLIMLIVKCALRSHNYFYIINKKCVDFNPQAKIELERTIQIDKNLIDKLRKLMPKICAKELDTEIEWLSTHNTRIFRLRGVSNLVFRTHGPSGVDHKSREAEVKQNFKNMICAQQVCATRGLKHIVIPHAKMFEIQTDKGACSVIAQQALNCRGPASVQKELHRECRNHLTKAAHELLTLITETGFEDVRWQHIPVVEQELASTAGSRHIGMINFGHTYGEENIPGTRGIAALVNCLFDKELVRAVIDDARHIGILNLAEAQRIASARNEAIDRDAQLVEFHRGKGILQDPAKKIEVDIEKLGLDLKESVEIFEAPRHGEDERIQENRPPELPGRSEISSKRLFMRDAIKQIITTLNESIYAASSTNESIERKRLVLINTNHMGPEMSRYFRRGWIERIINALVAQGHLFALNRTDGHGYHIQA